MEYWLADGEARVLGPVSLDVVRDLAARGRLSDVRAASLDGRTFVPLREVPELAAVVTVPPKTDAVARAQADATQQIRDWIASIRGRPDSEVFRVPATSSREAWRAAFFALVQRYVPGRLPPEATPELRLACEDAFLTLSERMVDIERRLRTAALPRREGTQPPPLPPTPHTSPPPEVSWRGGMIHVRLQLSKGDARPFVLDPENSWKSDGLFLQSQEKVMVGTPAEVTIAFDGHVTQIQAGGRVVGLKSSFPVGFSVKLLDLVEAQRSMIRTWVARANMQQG
jgi:hypothetical protein